MYCPDLKGSSKYTADGFFFRAGSLGQICPSLLLEGRIAVAEPVGLTWLGRMSRSKSSCLVFAHLAPGLIAQTLQVTAMN